MSCYNKRHRQKLVIVCAMHRTEKTSNLICTTHKSNTLIMLLYWCSSLQYGCKWGKCLPELWAVAGTFMHHSEHVQQTVQNEPVHKTVNSSKSNSVVLERRWDKLLHKCHWIAIATSWQLRTVLSGVGEPAAHSDMRDAASLRDCHLKMLFQAEPVIWICLHNQYGIRLFSHWK